MPDQDVGVNFPTTGLDVTCEFGRQPADTAPAGVNVRAFDPIANRYRGGSRVGLVRHIDATIFGDFPVQHINFLVDPQAGALNADSDNQLPGYVPDPSTNNNSNRNGSPGSPPRYVPPGGGGRPSNRNRPGPSGSPPPPPPPGPGVLRQSNTGQLQPGQTDFSFSFDSQPVIGSLIVVVARSVTSNHSESPGRIGPAVTVGGVRNDGGLSYTQIGTELSGSFETINTAGPTDFYRLSVWYYYATNGANDAVVRVATSGRGDDFRQCLATAFEFTGRQGGPVTVNTLSGSGSAWAASPTALTNTAGELVLAAFNGAANPYDGLNVSDNVMDGGFTTVPLSIYPWTRQLLGYKTTQATTVTPTATDPEGHEGEYGSITTSFVAQ